MKTIYDIENMKKIRIAKRIGRILNDKNINLNKKLYINIFYNIHLIILETIRKLIYNFFCQCNSQPKSNDDQIIQNIVGKLDNAYSYIYF